METPTAQEIYNSFYFIPFFDRRHLFIDSKKNMCRGVVLGNETGYVLEERRAIYE